MSDSWFIGTISRAHGLLRSGHRFFNTTFPDLKTPPNKAGDSKNTIETPRRPIGMMVSLDHTIYFHRPREVKADEWMCSEMETPWSGEGRGLVMQRIWNKEGRLIASCVQEVSLLGNQLNIPTMPNRADRHYRVSHAYNRRITTRRASCEYRIELSRGTLIHTSFETTRDYK